MDYKISTTGGTQLKTSRNPVRDESLRVTNKYGGGDKTKRTEITNEEIYDNVDLGQTQEACNSTKILQKLESMEKRLIKMEKRVELSGPDPDYSNI